MSYPTAILKINNPEASSFGQYIIAGVIPQSCLNSTDGTNPVSEIYKSEEDALAAVLADEWVQANPYHLIQLSGYSLYSRDRAPKNNTDHEGEGCPKCGELFVPGQFMHTCLSSPSKPDSFPIMPNIRTPQEALADLRLRIDLLIAQRRDQKRTLKAQEKWLEVSRVEAEATTLLHVQDMIDEALRKIAGAGDAASCFSSKDKSTH